MTHDFAASYKNCINSCRNVIKFCENNDKCLFAIEKENKSKKTI